MGGFESAWFGISMIVGVLIWGVIIWLAWMVVSSIRGMHTELIRIRELLAEGRPPREG